MAFFRPLFSLLIFQALSLCINRVHSSPHPILNLSDDKFIKLHAARRSSNLSKRDNEIQLTSTVELRYIDSNYAGHGSTFFSEVSLQSSKPLLLLEDVEHYVDHITCNPSTIQLRFAKNVSFTTTKGLCDELISSYIITSHAGCSEEGTRVPFLINAVSLSESDMIVQLGVQEKQWNEIPGELTIDYGHTEEHHELRRHASLGRRQGASPTTAIQKVSKSLIPTESPTDTSTSKVLNLAYESKPDSTFSFPLGVGPSAPVEIGCKLCKTTGNLKVTRGVFKLINISDINIVGTNITSPLDYVKSGSMQLEMNDFSAHIDLRITPSLSGGLNYTLYPVPIFGFSIPNIGKAGLLYDPQVKFNWELKGGIKFSYGFKLSIPSGSQISINLVNPNQSTITGFSKTTIDPIPFQANISDIELSMSLALQSRVTVAFSFFSDHILAEAAAFIDHPSENIKFTQLSTSNTDASCKSTDGIPFAEANFNQVFSNLTHITPEVNFKAGLDVRIEADIPALVDKAFGWDTVLMETAFLQPTACLVYQKSTGSALGGSFATASAVFAEMKALASSSYAAVAASSASASAAKAKETGGAKKSGAARLKCSLEEEKWWTFFICGCALLMARLASM